jgi:hypothetical protein
MCYRLRLWRSLVCPVLSRQSGPIRKPVSPMAGYHGASLSHLGLACHLPEILTAVIGQRWPHHPIA